MTTADSRIVGICIAAGASTRMGRPKALLDCGGETAAARALESLTLGGCDEIVLVLGAEAESIRAAISPARAARIVENRNWAEGRTGSVQTGIRAGPRAAAYVLLPVDHILVTFLDVGVLVGALRTAEPPRPRVIRTEYLATVPPFEEHPEPRLRKTGHPILFDATVAEAVLAAGPDDPLRDVLRPYAGRTTTVRAGHGVVVNVDTPEDYAAIVWGRSEEE